MNPRTVKKLKSELEASLQYCAQIHNLIRGIIFDVDTRQSPYLPPYLVIEGDQSNSQTASSSATPTISKQPMMSPPSAATAAPDASSMPWAMRQGAQPAQTKTPTPRSQPNCQPTASPGNPEGSALRKLRKKLPPNMEPPPNVPEFDNAGRRLVTKKEHHIRVFEILRFRALQQGDFVAARTTSRDLWILARVMKDYPGIDNMSPLEFLQLSETRRDSLFREKVQVKDVEEKDGSNFFQVARSLLLPLPRSYSEAAEWGQRIKKGMRVSFQAAEVGRYNLKALSTMLTFTFVWFRRSMPCTRIRLRYIQQQSSIALPSAEKTTISLSWNLMEKNRTRLALFQSTTSRLVLSRSFLESFHHLSLPAWPTIATREKASLALRVAPQSRPRRMTS